MSEKESGNKALGIGGIISGVGSLVGAADNIISGGYRQREGMRQQQAMQKELMEIQHQNALEQMKVGQSNMIEMQERYGTVGAKKKQLEAAGMNPYTALGLGNGGGGGVSGGQGAIGAASGQAPNSRAAEVEAMKLQAALGMSQVVLNKSLAKKAESEGRKADVETQNLGEGGIDTRVKEANIANLSTLTSNERIKGELLSIDKDIKAVEAEIAKATKDDVIRNVVWSANKAQEEWLLTMARAEREMRLDRLEEEEYETMRQQMRANVELLVAEAAAKYAGIQIGRDQARAALIQAGAAVSGAESNAYNARTGRFKMLIDAYMDAWGLNIQGKGVTVQEEGQEVTKRGQNVGALQELIRTGATLLMLSSRMGANTTQPAGTWKPAGGGFGKPR